MVEKKLPLVINGEKRSVTVPEDESLLRVLRDTLDLTGTKYGCGEGQCGACTVLVNNKPIRSCLTPAASVADKPITTIEGLAKGDKLSPVQEAFLAEGAMQCGYCIPGMIMSATGLLQRNPHPSEAEMQQAMQGNVCRCGGYPRILAAIRRAAKGGTK